MRRTLLLTLLALALPNALAHATLPLNGAQNGGFESGLAAWVAGGSASTIITPGAEGTSKALLVADAPCGRFVHQPLRPTAVGNAGVYLDFNARVVANAGNPLHNVIETLTAWNPATGAGQFTSWVAFQNGKVRFSVWSTNPLATAVETAAPTDGAWHHYQVLLNGPLGVGVLLVDGVPTLTATGSPASVGLADRIIVGDVSNCNAAAPSVAWDEIWVGPQL